MDRRMDDGRKHALGERNTVLQSGLSSCYRRCDRLLRRFSSLGFVASASDR